MTRDRLAAAMRRLHNTPREDVHVAHVTGLRILPSKSPPLSCLLRRQFSRSKFSSCRFGRPRNTPAAALTSPLSLWLPPRRFCRAAPEPPPKKRISATSVAPRRYCHVAQARAAPGRRYSEPAARRRLVADYVIRAHVAIISAFREFPGRGRTSVVIKWLSLLGNTCV